VRSNVGPMARRAIGARINRVPYLGKDSPKSITNKDPARSRADLSSGTDAGLKLAHAGPSLHGGRPAPRAVVARHRVGADSGACPKGPLRFSPAMPARPGAANGSAHLSATRGRSVGAALRGCPGRPSHARQPCCRIWTGSGSPLPARRDSPGDAQGSCHCSMYSRPDPGSCVPVPP
jgi:hypothetical protein